MGDWSRSQKSWFEFIRHSCSSSTCFLLVLMHSSRNGTAGKLASPSAAWMEELAIQYLVWIDSMFCGETYRDGNYQWDRRSFGDYLMHLTFRSSWQMWKVQTQKTAYVSIWVCFELNAHQISHKLCVWDYNH